MKEHEIIKGALDKFVDTYQPKVSDLTYKLRAGITKIKEDGSIGDQEKPGKLAIFALCQFKNSSDISDAVKEQIAQRLPEKFEYMGTEDPVSILYEGIPKSH